MTKVIATQLYPRIEKEFIKDKELPKKISNHIRKIIDRHAVVLYKSGPFDRIYLKEEDLSYINTALNIDNKEVKTYIKQITFIKSGWQALNNPFAFLMLTMIRRYHLTKDPVNLKISLFFLSLHYYAIIHVRLFKFVQKETMEYTINNLSNKHDLKIYGTVFKALEKKLETFHTTYSYLLDSTDDKKLADYIMNLNTRIFQWLGGIQKEYRKNKESGNYFNSSSENLDPDNFRETTNISQDLTKVAQNITMKILTNPTIFELCEKAAKINDISPASLMDTLNQIKKSGDPRLQVLIQSILEVFIIDGKNSMKEISSQKFLNSSLMLYKKSNTSNESIIVIKKILDEWLNEYSERYSRTERLATRINFRKALFMYYVFCIQFFYNK